MTSSEFYERLNRLETSRQLGIGYLRNKGVDIANTASLSMIINKINTIQIDQTSHETVINTNGSVVIVTAEMPGVTLTLKDEGNTTIAVQTTPETTGGAVAFTISDFATAQAYKVVATLTANGNQLWENTVQVDNIGIYYCKSGKALEDYTWEEINFVAKHGYAKYMFEIWDTKKLTSFLGNTNDVFRTCHILGFDHDDAVSGGKAGITFVINRTPNAYKHANSAPNNINGISWVGSLIRANCMMEGETYYVFDPSVTKSTNGIYYTLNSDNKTFSSVTLPTAFVAGTKYYTATTLESDGAFIAGLPAGFKDNLVKVIKKTWDGYGGTVTNSTLAANDNHIIITEDFMFILSDGEVYGNVNRRTTVNGMEHGKHLLEGAQYEAFKGYNETGLIGNNDRWLRSPVTSDSAYFCVFGNTGSIGRNNANNSNYCHVCFCI